MSQWVQRMRNPADSAGLRDEYQQYLLMADQNHIAVIAFVIGMFNMLLLIPDLALVGSGTGKVIIMVIRLAYSAAAFIMAFLCYSNRVRTFIGFSTVVSIYELGAVGLYFCVMNQYQPPNFLIQAMGLMIVILCIFFIPNLWTSMLFVSALAIGGFVLLSLMLVPDLALNLLAAGISYLAAAAILCALFSYNLDKHRYVEYKAKREQIDMNATDPLTKAHSRNKLAEVYIYWSTYSQRHQVPMTLVLFDIDQFKHVNDIHGHVLADAAMVDLVSVISKQMRSLDILARWGGDEFVLLLPHTDLKTAIYVTDRIRRIIEKTKFNKLIQLTCSFGAVLVEPEQNLDQMVDAADSMMYQAKRNGGNQVFTDQSVPDNN